MDARTAQQRRRRQAQLAAEAGPSRRVNVTIRLKSAKVKKRHTYTFKVAAHRDPNSHQIRGDLIYKAINKFRQDYNVLVSKTLRPQLESYTVLDD